MDFDQLPVLFILGPQFIDGNVSVARHEDLTFTFVDGSSAPLLLQETVRFML